MSKNPDQTLEKILAVSTKLFIDKGFNNTSVQDIINELGMSKGAIYHYFKTKKEILDTVIEIEFENNVVFLKKLVEESKAVTYKEKLKEAFEQLVLHSNVRMIDVMTETQIENPHFIVVGLKNTVDRVAPLIRDYILKGIKDGSIKTDYPEEASEVLMLLLNIWLNPSLFERNKEETIKRMKFLQHIMVHLGIDVISETLMEKISDVYDNAGSYHKDM